MTTGFAWAIAAMAVPFVTLLLLGFAVAIRPTAASGVAAVVSAFADVLGALRRDRQTRPADLGDDDSREQ